MTSAKSNAIIWVKVNNVFERVKDVFNAITGRKATCGSNCSCGSLGDEAGEGEAPLGDFVEYDFSQCSPELQDVIDGMLCPEGLRKLQDEIDRQEEEGAKPTEDPSVGIPGDPVTPCIHMEVRFLCHCQEGDMKPITCSASTCPARAQAQVRATVKELENARMFN